MCMEQHRVREDTEVRWVVAKRILKRPLKVRVPTERHAVAT